MYIYNQLIFGVSQFNMAATDQLSFSLNRFTDIWLTLVGTVAETFPQHI